MTATHGNLRLDWTMRAALVGWLRTSITAEPRRRRPEPQPRHIYTQKKGTP